MTFSIIDTPADYIAAYPSNVVVWKCDGCGELFPVVPTDHRDPMRKHECTATPTGPNNGTTEVAITMFGNDTPEESEPDNTQRDEAAERYIESMRQQVINVMFMGGFETRSRGEDLRSALVTIQRQAFNAGFDAGRWADYDDVP